MSSKLNNIKAVKEILSGTHKSQTRKIVGGFNSSETVTRNVGDTWVDDEGNHWEQKKGYRVNSGRQGNILDSVRKSLNSAPKCPKKGFCTFDRSDKLDRKFQLIHGTCFDCGVSMEQEMKLNGTWDRYQADKKIQNMQDWLDRSNGELEEVVESLRKTPEYVNEKGMVEEKWEWSGNVEALITELREEYAKAVTIVEEQIQRLKEVGNTNEDT